MTDPGMGLELEWPVWGARKIGDFTIDVGYIGERADVGRQRREAREDGRAPDVDLTDPRWRELDRTITEAIWSGA